MAVRPFPVLLDYKEHKQFPDFRSVPWEWLAPHESQALANHDQTLKTLASRGGLSPQEMLAIVHHVHVRTYLKMPLADAIQAIDDCIAQWSV